MKVNGKILDKGSKETIIDLLDELGIDSNCVVVEKNGFTRFRKVKTGSRNLLTVEVLEGLTKGENVVVETPHLMKDGQRVKPIFVGLKK